MKEVRKLKFSDLGLASKIIKKLQLRVDNTSGSIEQLGASLFLKLLENYNIVENEVAEFMSKLIEGMSKDEFLNLELKEVLEYIDLIKKDEGLKVFLKTLSTFVEKEEKK